jgi:hypothetical protein
MQCYQLVEVPDKPAVLRFHMKFAPEPLLAGMLIQIWGAGIIASSCYCERAKLRADFQKFAATDNPSCNLCNISDVPIALITTYSSLVQSTIPTYQLYKSYSPRKLDA